MSNAKTIGFVVRCEVPGNRVVIPLTTIEGIGPAYAGRLQKAGIHNTRALLEQGATRSGRQAIARDAHSRSALIQEWVSQVDLLRIRGVGPE